MVAARRILRRGFSNQIAPYGRSGSNFGSRWDNDKQKYIKSKETTKNEEKYDEYIKQAELYESYIKNCPLSLAEINFDADEDEVYQQMLYLCNLRMLLSSSTRNY